MCRRLRPLQLGAAFRWAVQVPLLAALAGSPVVPLRSRPLAAAVAAALMILLLALPR